MFKSPLVKGLFRASMKAMQELFLPSRGIAYRVSELRHDRPTLVFVHGLSGSLSAWFPFEKKFGGAYNLITFDLRGHGLSARPKDTGGHAMVEFIEDLHVLLDALGVMRCTLISHSFGTLIAMEFAATHPERVERAVFVAPAYGVYRFSATRILTNILAFLALFPLRLRPYGRTDYARFHDTPDYSLSRILTDILNMGLRSYLRCMRTIFARDYDMDWKALGMPVLLIHGKKDRIVPYAHAEALHRALPRAVLAPLSGNHILVINNIDEVAGLIEKFIAQ